MASSKTAIYGALVANLLIAITKFIAGIAGKSGSMISEAIHSVVDTVNELLLLLGLHRAKKEPDASHPFGYGKELYFWSFIVSILIFGLGGGISIFQGIMHIREPESIGDPTMSYWVLGLSVLFEGASLVIAVLHFREVRGSTPFWEAVIKSKDPSNFMVLFEDAAAVAGLVIVGVFMYLNVTYDLPILDGIASVIVGLILVAVSAILARESRSLLMGEGVSPNTKNVICELVQKDEAVVKVLHIMSTYQSPDEVLLMLIIEFDHDLDTLEINDAIDRIRVDVKAKYPLMKYIIIQPDILDGTLDRHPNRGANRMGI
ncbi:cation diffusion facilitator family transporter [Mucilaginibacter myungsuensis]|uniref:Cation diffusion facilitator family transporter n=1 Tax=Mucilaginibacter myungsuensis TaxID=649104 RepID=A0A929KW34_9SPHI|nr:cation diffusion facilitator family transporter [Mucilaginibacter myungsuensis]MBE9662681.1 cation diffusion facilitator family transporter [Mucilaginibacter myungsuensis]MDN3598101.1 cation diffusion facilitator family transporter [Mucilaginibacter myungsuensis]